MFFDIYEMEGTTFREFGESKLENINLSKVKIYKVCLDAIRSRHGSHKELLLHSKLLWENMSLGVRIFRVIYYHAEKFLLDSQKIIRRIKSNTLKKYMNLILIRVN